MGLETKAQIKAAILQGRTQIANDLGIVLPGILNAMLDSYVDFPNKPAVSVTDPQFGAVTDGSSDSSAAFQNAANAVNAAAVAQGNRGGAVIVPPGNYVLRTGVTLPPGVWLVGTDLESCYLHDNGANLAPIVTMTGTGSLANLTISGCGGASNEPVPTFSAVKIDAGGGVTYIDKCSILYGNVSVDVKNTTLLITQTFLGWAYGNATVQIGDGAELHMSQSFIEQSWPFASPAQNTTYPSDWTANTVHAPGDLVLIPGPPKAMLQCMSVIGDARTGSVVPPGRTTPYFTDIIDNHVTWQVAMTNNGCNAIAFNNSQPFSGVFGIGRNSLEQSKFSGSYDTVIYVNSAAATVAITDCYIDGGATASVGLGAATDVEITNCHLFAGWAAGTPPGAAIWAFGPANVESLLISNCYINGRTQGYGVNLEAGVASAMFTGTRFSATARGLNITAGVGNFNGSDNTFSGGTPLLVPAGASNHYIFTNNLLGGGTISDAGTGPNKTITGNV